jgi:hypothetical protein
MLMMQSRFQLKKKQTQRWNRFQRLSTNQNKHPNLENVVSMVSVRYIAENVGALRSAPTERKRIIAENAGALRSVHTESKRHIAENVGVPRFARMES